MKQTIINGVYTDHKERDELPDRTIKREFFILTGIYGFPLVLGWGYSVMGGVKFNPYLALMAVPFFGSMVVCGAIGIIHKWRSANE